jgi:hypothetical protein
LDFLDPTSNFTYGAFLRDANAAVDPDGTFSELTDTGGASPDIRLFVEQKTGESLVVSATDTGSDDLSSWLVLAAEFRAFVAESIQQVVPAVINGTSTVSGTVFKGEDKAVAPRATSGPWPFFFDSDESIVGRSVVSGTIFVTNTGTTPRPVVPNPGGIQGTSSVSAIIHLVTLTITPAAINGSSSVTAAIFGGTPVTGPIDFIPEVGAAPALILPFLPGADALPGSFAFTHLRED